MIDQTECELMEVFGFLFGFQKLVKQLSRCGRTVRIEDENRVRAMPRVGVSGKGGDRFDRKTMADSFERLEAATGKQPLAAVFTEHEDQIGHVRGVAYVADQLGCDDSAPLVVGFAGPAGPSIHSRSR